MKDVMLLGEPMGLFIAEELGDSTHVNRFTKGISGAEVNVGTGLARLGFDVDFMTKLGKDPFGYYIDEYLKNEHIGTDLIIFDDEYKTGIQMKGKVEEGDPDVAYYRKGSAFSTLSVKEVEKIDFRDVQLFHVTGIPPALGKSTREAVFYLLEKAKSQNCYITFDPNLRHSLWESQEVMIEVLNKIAEYADLVLPGVSEGQELTGKDSVEEIAQFYHELGAKGVIIKDGSKGAHVSETGKEITLVPGFKVEKVVDTVGAGDGFAVGVISAYLDGLSLEESARRGNAIGSIQVQHQGDNEGLPTREQLLQYMEQKA